MKLLQILLIAIVCTVSLNASGRSDAGSKVGASFAEVVYDFGTVKADGGPVVHDYPLTNKGGGALAILSVKANCGCTVADYPHKPLQPGESAAIKVKFTTTGQRGEVAKDIRVKLRNASGRSETVVLRLKGSVLP